MNRASYLDPAILSRVSNLQLRAKMVAEGFVSGLHQSSYKGYSLEFDQHREYVSGDELKHIDWKVYARTDRFFIKQFREETNLRVNLILDGSGSMGFKGKKSPWHKYDFGATLAATLASLTLRQGDSVGLGVIQAGALKMIPARNSVSHLNILIDRLSSSVPSGLSSVAGGLEEAARAVHKRSLFILISDLYDDPNAFFRAVQYLRFRKNEVIVIHVMDRDELDLPYSGSVRFDSMEDGSNIALETDDFREEYRASIQQFIELQKLTLRNSGVHYHFHSTDESPDRVLKQVLASGA